MKSIKEKSENLYPDKKVVLARGNTCLSCGRVKRESFEAGANYVLDAIIECMPRTHSFNPNEAIDIIANRIKELKSNQ